jgi:hypothetical protein
VGFSATLRDGKADGYPLCCRLRYALEELADAHSEQCLRRGVRFTPEGDVYVPCRVLHRPMLSHAAWERVLAGISVE